MIRIKLANNVTLDVARNIQNHYVSCRNKYPERHKKRISSTVQIKPACVLKDKSKEVRLYHVWLNIRKTDGLLKNSEVN